MIRADDKAARRSGERILSHHALAGLDISKVKIKSRLFEEITRLALDAIERGVGGRFDIDGHDPIR